MGPLLAESTENLFHRVASMLRRLGGDANSADSRIPADQIEPLHELSADAVVPSLLIDSVMGTKPPCGRNGFREPLEQGSPRCSVELVGLQTPPGEHKTRDDAG